MTILTDLSQNTVQKPKTTCVFCNRWADGDEIWVAKYTYCFAIYSKFAVNPGHVLVIPYDHIADWFATPVHIQQEMMQALNECKIMLDEKFHPDGYNVGINCGTAAGQTVMHLHLHLIPRYIGDVPDPRGGVRGVIPERQKY